MRARGATRLPSRRLDLAFVLRPMRLIGHPSPRHVRSRRLTDQSSAAATLRLHLPRIRGAHHPSLRSRRRGRPSWRRSSQRPSHRLRPRHRSRPLPHDRRHAPLHARPAARRAVHPRECLMACLEPRSVSTPRSAWEVVEEAAAAGAVRGPPGLGPRRPDLPQEAHGPPLPAYPHHHRACGPNRRLPTAQGPPRIP